MRLLLASLLFLSTLITAAQNPQNPSIYNANWNLTDLVINGVSNPPPSNAGIPNVPIIIQILTNGDHQLFTHACDGHAMSFILTFSGVGDFNVGSGGQLSGGCIGGANINLADNQAYDYLYTEFWFGPNFNPMGRNFVYNIVTTTNGETLSITNDEGDTAIYGWSTNSIDEERLIKLFVYPNPSSNELYWDTNQPVIISRIKVIDLSGRTVLALKNSLDFIDISQLAIGRYFFSLELVNGQKIVQSFIKL